MHFRQPGGGGLRRVHVVNQRWGQESSNQATRRSWFASRRVKHCTPAHGTSSWARPANWQYHLPTNCFYCSCQVCSILVGQAFLHQNLCTLLAHSLAGVLEFQFPSKRQTGRIINGGGLIASNFCIRSWRTWPSRLRIATCLDDLCIAKNVFIQQTTESMRPRKEMHVQYSKQACCSDYSHWSWSLPVVI